MPERQERELDSLQKQYDLLSEKIDRLRRAVAIEAAVADKFEQEKQLEEAEGERAAVEEKMERVRRGEAAVRFYANIHYPLEVGYIHYPLEVGFAGRTQELTTLGEWFSQDKEHPLFALIALGGTGKSALAWYWQQGLQKQLTAPPTVIWWSFYEAGVAEFLSEVLIFLGDKPPELDGPRLQMNRLLAHLRERPALLVLDGAERLLIAYSGMGAAYQADEESEGGEYDQHGQECRESVAASLLIGLAQLQESKTLLTSRMLPHELEGRGGELLQGVCRHDLTGLDPEAAYQLFITLNVKTTRAEVQEICEPLEYHPLSLRLLAGYAADHPKTPNDLRAVADYDVTTDLKGRQQHILTRSYSSLPKRVQQLLSRLSAFRGSVGWEIIEAVFDVKKQIYSDLRLLRRRGLLHRNIQNGKTSYDLHPIVRHYAYVRLVDPASLHNKLVSYFEAVPRPAKVISLADLNPVIELYYHLVQAGRYDDACGLYHNRLHKRMYFQLGAYHQGISLLRSLFPDGEEQPPRLSKENAQAGTLIKLAYYYSMAGRPEAAVPLFERHNALGEKAGDKKTLAVGLVNLANMAQINIGDLASAAENLRRSIDFSREVEDLFWEAIGHHGLGTVLIYTGDWVGAEAELALALKTFTSEEKFQSQGIVWAYRALAALLQGDGQAGNASAQKALRLADRWAQIEYPVEREYVRAYWLLGWANLLTGNLDAAQEYLDTALRRCRGSNMVESEPAVLLAQARLVHAVGQDTTKYVDEALEIAKRSRYQLNLAEIHNFLAQLALDEGNKVKARENAQQAYDYAWCNGSPYSYAVALAEAERLLKEAG
jgi:tetratricopeptide (TPR) repeat protein